MSLPTGFTLSSIPADHAAGRALQTIENAAIKDSPDNTLSNLLWPTQTNDAADEDEDPFHTIDMLSDATNVYLWISDKTTNTPIAYAWGQRAPKRSEAEWAEAYANRHRPPGMNTALMDATSGVRFLKRAKILGSADSLIIKELYVRPDYQRRGLGGVLVGKMVQRADELGLPAYLESSTVGYNLYTRHGFREIDRVVVDLASWGGSKGQVSTYVLMLRTPQRS